MRQFGAGRPDADDEKELQKFADKILAKLSENNGISTEKLLTAASMKMKDLLSGRKPNEIFL